MKSLGVVFVLAACGSTSSTTTDSGIDPDVPRPDADPSCRQWRQVRVPISNIVSLESLPVHPKRTALLLVDVAHCPDDLPAMPTHGFTLENEFLALTMSVWRSAPDCANPTIVQRPVGIVFPYAGQWKSPDVASFMIDVVAAPGGNCATGGNACQRDCDCAQGEACVSGYGFAGPIQRCARPCELDRDCAGTGTCITQIADDLSFVCGAGSECNPGDCPQGFACANNACTPQFSLGSVTRHDCTCDSECSDGLRCVFHEGVATGRCEAVCLTASEVWCQGPHFCNVPSVERPGICGWIGE